MKKILKYGLFALLGVLLLVAGALSYFIATFDANVYKPQIIQAVKDKQNRTLKLDGEIKLTIFPSIGARLEKISLSEHNSDKEFAAIDSAHVSLALLPLLAKQVVVSEVALSGVTVTVNKFKDGSTNLDDLLGKQEANAEVAAPKDEKAQSAVKFDIAAVKIENTNLSYNDEATGAQYSLKNLNLKTGRIANGVPGKLALDALVQANKPKLDVAVQLSSGLTFDLDKKLFQVEDLDLQVKGSVLDISELLLKVSGSASANLSTQEYSAKKLSLEASGVKAKDKFDASVALPDFTFASDKVVASKLQLNANLDGALGKLVAVLNVQDMQGNAKAFKSSGLVLDVALTQPEQEFKLKLSTPLAGSAEAKQLNLSNIVLALSATGDKLPGKALSSEMKGSVQLDGERESVLLNLAGGLLQSQVKAKLAVKGFANPAIRFDLDVDQFDADLFMPKKAAAPVAKAEPAAEQPFDLSALQKLNVQGSIRIGSLKVANVKTTQLRIDVKADKGQFNISPLSANLYQGSISGSVAVNAAQATPTFAVKQNLNGVELGPLVKDAADFDVAEGKANVVVNLSTQGNTVTAIKKDLNGTLALNMADGAVKGIDLGKLVHAAQNIGSASGVQTLKPVAGDKTAFTDLRASFKVNKGVAHNDDLLLKSQSLKVTGNGDVDIGNSSIDYGVKATLAEAVDGKSGSLTVPVQLSGPFAELKFKVDYGAVLADIAKQKVGAKVDAKKEELKEQLQEKLKGGLKDLFK
jgi:AsmA protein